MTSMFFFGTLMDRNVLGRVLGRPVREGELTAATLDGYARLAVVGASYPVLVARPAGEVDGILFRPLDRRERARIDHLESEEYAARTIAVRAAGREIDADCYMPLDGVFEVTDEPWRLAEWRRHHMPHYLVLCDGWMASFKEPYSAEPAGKRPQSRS